MYCKCSVHNCKVTIPSRLTGSADSSGKNTNAVKLIVLRDEKSTIIFFLKLFVKLNILRY